MKEEGGIKNLISKIKKGKEKMSLGKNVRCGAHYLSLALLTASLVIILLYKPVNMFIMRSSGSYVVYMLVFALIIGLSVYIFERIMVDIFGYTIDPFCSP